MKELMVEIFLPNALLRIFSNSQAEKKKENPAHRRHCLLEIFPRANLESPTNQSRPCRGAKPKGESANLFALIYSWLENI